MTNQERFIRRIEEILHPHQGIKPGANAKAMICEAYDIHITGIPQDKAEARTEELVDFLKDQGV